MYRCTISESDIVIVSPGLLAHLDVHDPGMRAEPGQQRHTPGQHSPGHPVTQLVHGAESDVGLSHLRINFGSTFV